MEKVAKENPDSFDLVKINIDDNKQIAAQLRIQSIPAVFAFKDKKVINAFQGVIPEQKIKEFIESSSGEQINNNKVFYDEVKELINNKNFSQAEEL